MRKCGVSIFVIFLLSLCFAETPNFTNRIRLPLWAELDAYPELKEAKDFSQGVFDYPISRIKEISPFLMNALVYGWKFKYTPSDKLRGVDEIFEVEEINKINEARDGKILYTKPWIENNKLYCWVEFERTPQMVWNFRQWTSIVTDKIQGKGKAKVSLGFDGIKNAADDALKNAVREHFRKIIKNKPKQITGKVIVSKEPRIGVISGKYVIDLDFFLETDKIVMYREF